MDITAETIEKIEELAVKASGANAFGFHGERGRVKIVNTQTGTFEYKDLPPLAPIIQVRGLDDLTAAIEDYHGIDSEPTCFVDESSVVAFFDDTRNGSATLPLRINPAIGVLKTLKDLPPAKLRRLLRVDLFDVISSPLDFCETISVLKFEATQTNEVALRKGDESIGKSVRSKVTAEQDIPDTVTFTLSVYPDLVEQVQTTFVIRCAVVTDPAAGTVSVLPYPGEIDRAITLAVTAIQTELRRSVNDLHVYCGRMMS